MSFPGNSQPDLNLEQQRKRAKDLRRGHRDRNLEAAVRVARHLPRARNQSAEEVLRSTLTLSEAQFVVAREAGFSSWPKLKHHIEESTLRGADLGRTSGIKDARAVVVMVIVAVSAFEPSRVTVGGETVQVTVCRPVQLQVTFD